MEREPKIIDTIPLSKMPKESLREFAGVLGSDHLFALSSFVRNSKKLVAVLREFSNGKKCMDIVFPITIPGYVLFERIQDGMAAIPYVAEENETTEDVLCAIEQIDNTIWGQYKTGAIDQVETAFNNLMKK